MNDQIQEQLSALMDGELSRDERGFLLRRLEHDSELRATWTRMHLMRDVLSRKQSSAPNDLADRVMRALDAERQAAPALKRSGLWRPIAGAALAASVALMAVLSVRVDTPSQDPGLALQPAARSALPEGIPGPMLPDPSALTGGVQPVSASSSVLLRPAPQLTPNDVLLLRHGQLSNSAWTVGGEHVYQVPLQNAAYEPTP